MNGVCGADGKERAAVIFGAYSYPSRPYSRSCIKGETPAEIAGLARAMMSKAVQVKTKEDVVDIVGTGGDGIGALVAGRQQ